MISMFLKQRYSDSCYNFEYLGTIWFRTNPEQCWEHDKHT